MGVLEPQKRLIAGLGGNTESPKPQPAPKAASAPKPPKSPEFEPLAVQPDEHSDYMQKAGAKIFNRLNKEGQAITTKRLLKTGSSKSSSKR